MDEGSVKSSPAIPVEIPVDDSGPATVFMNQLGRILDDLEKSLSILTGKITPVLGPGYPSPSSDGDEDSEEVSPLSRDLREYIFRVDRMTRAIHDLTKRVEL